MKLAAVVLAAGESRRLGRPKQDLILAGETLLDRAVHTATEADLLPIVVLRKIMRNAEEAERLQHTSCDVVMNPDADEGMASSIHCGVQRAAERGIAGVVLMTCDQVLVDAAHLRTLTSDPDQITGSGYAGKVGIPAYFPASNFAALLELRGDIGARALLQDAHIIVNEELRFDIDTEADVSRAKACLQKAQSPTSAYPSGRRRPAK